MNDGVSFRLRRIFRHCSRLSTTPTRASITDNPLPTIHRQRSIINKPVSFVPRQAKRQRYRRKLASIVTAAPAKRQQRQRTATAPANGNSSASETATAPAPANGNSSANKRQQRQRNSSATKLQQQRQRWQQRQRNSNSSASASEWQQQRQRTATAPAKWNDHQRRLILRGCSVSEAKEEQKTLLFPTAKGL